MSNLVQKIEELCNKKNITFYNLEQALGFGNGTIRRWNNNIPKTDRLTKVADYFDVSIDYLLGREEQQNELLFLRGGDKLTPEEREELKKILQMSADVYLRAKGLID